MKFIQKIMGYLIEKYIEPKINERVQYEVSIRMGEYRLLEKDIKKHDVFISGIDNNLAALEIELREHIDVEIDEIIEPDSQLAIEKIEEIGTKLNTIENELRKHMEVEENLAIEPTSQLIINLLEDSIRQIKNEGLSILEINRIMNTLNSYKNEKVNVSLNKKDNIIYSNVPSK